MDNLIKWELFSHDADIGVRGTGVTLNEAFEMGATALTAIITEPNRISPETSISILCAAPELEVLFVDWLNSIIYEMEVQQMLFTKYHVIIERLASQYFQLTAQAIGEKIDFEKHKPAVIVKGATYTNLLVKHENSIWTVQCVVDV